MANKKGKEIDNTCLRLTEAHRRAFLHRDYLAHYLRWSHVCRFLLEGKRHKTAHVIDVGCGKEFPLPRMMYSNMLTHTTGSYTGVDYNKLGWPDLVPKDSKSFRVTLHGEANFCDVKLERKTYDLAVSFEVMEHVEPMMTYEMLRRISTLLLGGGTGFISTPVFDPKVGAASNHVNEMSYWGFEMMLAMAGLVATNRWGTFASQKDYKDILTAGQREVFDALRPYYDSQVMAVILAPLFPHKARNVIWQVRHGSPFKAQGEVLRRLSHPDNSSSARWSADVKKIARGIK